MSTREWLFTMPPSSRKSNLPSPPGFVARNEAAGKKKASAGSGPKVQTSPTTSVVDKSVVEKVCLIKAVCDYTIIASVGYRFGSNQIDSDEFVYAVDDGFWVRDIFDPHGGIRLATSFPNSVSSE